MKHKKRDIICLIIGITLVMLSYLVSMYKQGFKINLTASSPYTIWKTEKNKEKIERGDHVLICPDKKMIKNHPFLKNLKSPLHISCQSINPMVKKIIGIPGDQVKIDNNGIEINNHLIQGSKPIKKRGKIINTENLNQNQYIVIGETSKSLDSRYFGAINERIILTKIEPIY